MKEARDASNKIHKSALAAVASTHYRGQVFRVLDRAAAIAQQGEIGNQLSEISDRMSDLEGLIQAAAESSIYSDGYSDPQTANSVARILAYFEIMTPYEFWALLRDLREKLK